MRYLAHTIPLFFIALCHAYAQPETVMYKESLAGKNLITNQNITCREYFFPGKIYKAYIDNSSKILTVLLRPVAADGTLKKTGRIGGFSIPGKKLLWMRKFNYQTSYLSSIPKGLFEVTNQKSYALDVHTGDYLWEAKNSISYLSGDNMIAMGYAYNRSNYTGNTNTNQELDMTEEANNIVADNLEAISLTNGKFLWNRVIDRKYGWDEVRYLNDSIMLISSSGLHSVNLKNGNGWDYEAKTGVDKHTVEPGMTAAGVALGALTGVSVMVSEHDVITNIVSNVLIDSPYLYLASKKTIACLNYSGKVIWSVPLEKNITSKSNLWLKGDTLFMINRGYANLNASSETIDFGKPFLAAYSKKTGQELFCNYFDHKKNIINDLQVRGNIVYLLFADKVTACSLNNGAVMLNKQFKPDVVGKLEQFTGREVYIDSAKGFRSLVQSDTANLYITTGSYSIIALDSKLDVAKQIQKEILYTQYDVAGKYKLFFKDHATTIVNDKQQKIAHINYTAKPFLLGTTLYDTREDSFAEIDLKEVLK